MIVAFQKYKENCEYEISSYVLLLTYPPEEYIKIAMKISEKTKN